MLQLVTYDLETFWSATHSLSKMNPIEYVMHKDTEIQSLAIKFDDRPTIVQFGETEIATGMRHTDFSNTMIIAHNGSGFDHMITAWRMGVRPKAWGCTLAMARPFFGLTCGVSLKAVAEALGLGQKGSLDAVNTKGKKLSQFTPDEIQKMRVYNKQDTDLCYAIFKALAPRLGKHELQLIDMFIRMTVEPELEADRYLLQTALRDERARKQEALLSLATVAGVWKPGMEAVDAECAMRDIVMSQPQFAALLQQLGAPIPMKESPSVVDPITGRPKLIPALAKNDQGLTDLLEHPDYRVQVAAATRMEVKTTQLETRLQTFDLVAGYCNGKLPMPNAYCGAFITWRSGGMMKLNMLNLPRVNPKKPKPSDSLRGSIVAPDDKVIVVVDSSNIELRVAHMLAGQWDTVDKLRNGEDLYCWFASILFGREVTKADTLERFIGKVAMLSLQYQSGWKTFQNMVRVLSGGETELDDAECKRVVAVWRSMFPAITDKDSGIWSQGQQAILAMSRGYGVDYGCGGLVHTEFEKTITPTGHWLAYPDLRQHIGSKGYPEWQYGQGRSKSRIYGGMYLENLSQHISRLIIMEQTLKLHKRYPVKHSVYDEAVLLVDEDEGPAAKAYALKCFSESPSWWKDIPLAAEADIGYSYSEAK